MLNSYKSQMVDSAAADICRHVMGTMSEFYDARRPYEEKAIEWWTNFISQYNPAKNWRKKEGEKETGKMGRSRIFVKLTQLKCYSAHAKVMHALSNGGELPLQLEPLKTLMPSIPPEQVAKAADTRSRILQDYAKHIKFIDTLDDVILSGTIFPCGIMKGPILKREKVLSFQPQMIGGMSASAFGLTPFSTIEDTEDFYYFEEVPWWDYYVDPNAKISSDSVAEIQYSRMYRARFRQLLSMPGYHPKAVKMAIEDIELLSKSKEGEYDKDKERLNEAFFTGYMDIKDSKVPIIEYQGLMEAGLIRKTGGWVPDNIRDDEEVESIVSVAGESRLLRANYNVMGARQFMGFRWRKYPNTIYGIGPAGLMDDSQSIINSSIRMIIDNKALSGNGMVALNPEKINMVSSGGTSIFPRKTWILRGNAMPKEAIDSVSFPDTTHGLRELVELFMSFADEETAIPKDVGGESMGKYLNKTMGGMSMLLGQQNLNLTPVLREIDNKLLEPAMERLDRVLSISNVYPQEANIPMKVAALGTMSLVAREIVIENMLRLLSITDNPNDAVMVDRRKVIREVVEKMGLSNLVRTEEQIRSIEMEIAERAKNQPPEQKARVDIDRLYNQLSRKEQMQILEMVGIVPDPSFPGFTPDGKGIMPKEIEPAPAPLPGGSMGGIPNVPPVAGGMMGGEEEGMI